MRYSTQCNRLCPGTSVYWSAMDGNVEYSSLEARRTRQRCELGTPASILREITRIPVVEAYDGNVRKETADDVVEGRSQQSTRRAGREERDSSEVEERSRTEKDRSRGANEKKINEDRLAGGEKLEGNLGMCEGFEVRPNKL